jgi:hypothetical protein
MMPEQPLFSDQELGEKIAKITDAFAARKAGMTADAAARQSADAFVDMMMGRTDMLADLMQQKIPAVVDRGRVGGARLAQRVSYSPRRSGWPDKSGRCPSGDVFEGAALRARPGWGTGQSGRERVPTSGRARHRAARTPPTWPPRSRWAGTGELGGDGRAGSGSGRTSPPPPTA